jgi:hypothetical protein
VYTLSLTDLFSGWSECVPLPVCESDAVIESVAAIRGSLPFRLRGLAVDSGLEFLGEALRHHCTAHDLEFTRPRPHHRNNPAWIEKKTGSVVRRLVGYRRLEGMAAVEALSSLYAASRLYVNFFQPSVRVKEKSGLIKRYQTMETPCTRLLGSSALSEEVKSEIRSIVETLDPLHLLDEIRKMQSHLALLSAGFQLHNPVPQQNQPSRLLVPTASRQGEARATRCKIPKPPRYWRTHKDAFEAAWPTIRAWLDADPVQTSKDLFERLRCEFPGVYREGQLRSLQRRLKEWRSRMELSGTA